MYILTVTGKEEELGAYSVSNEEGEKILYIFEEEDDASRYAMLMEEDGYPEMNVLEVEEDLIYHVCEINEHEYTIITPDDIVIPPKYSEHDFI